MKKTSLLILSMITLPVYAQDIMKALLDHQPTRRASSMVSTSSINPEVGSTTVKTTVSGKNCQELQVNEQRSLPMKVITSLIQDEPRTIDISHDPRTGILKISSKDMISNCNSMIEWKVNQTAINGENAYTVEARFKQGADCKNNVCNYQVAKVENGSFSKFETMALAPNLKGFKSCLSKAGVFKPDEATKKEVIQPEAIYYAPISEKAADIKDTGKLLFVSEGPESVQIGGRHGPFAVISDCKHYEVMSPSQKLLLSQADEDKNRLAKEAQELEACTVNEYHRVADFLDTYSGFDGQLKDVRDRLIKEAAVKSAAAILEGKATEEDLKVLADFNKYIVDPKVDQAIALYEQIDELKGEEKTKKQAELKKVLLELAAFANKPYYQQGHTDKLMATGKFEDAEKLNEVRLTIAEYTKLGSKENNVEVTVDVIENRIAKTKIQFSDSLAKIQEKYEIRTGQSTGNAKLTYEAATAIRRTIQRYTASYHEAIQERYKKIQPGGYCYAYFRNTQKCVQEQMEDIQELQFALAKRTKTDMETIATLETKAAEFKALEEEGRRYVASQGGEPTPASTEEASYSFDFTPQVAGQQPPVPQPGMQQPMQQQGYWPQAQGMGMYNPMNPYASMGPSMGMGMYGQQNPFAYQQPMMGQTGAFGGQFGFQANMGASPYMGMQQPMFGGQMGYGQMGYGQPSYGQPQGYWGQPYSAMNNYSMYR